MSVFPFDDLKVGDVTPVKCRRVRFRGELESDAEFGQWQNETVSHLQRDPKGYICVIAFKDYGVEFDPRYDYIPANGGTHACLMNEEYQLQFHSA